MKIKNLKRKIIFLFISITCLFSFLFTIISSATIVYQQNQNESKNIIPGDFSKVSDSVKKHIPTIIKYMQKYKIPENYLPYILAQAMQESGGAEIDIFQASESKYNGQIGMIKTAEESIEHAMKRWREIIDQIKIMNLEFSIPLVLQTYNFGSGYLNWVKNNGNKYTKQNAINFSNHMLKTLSNWIYRVYGDIDYVDHVYRYVSFQNSDDNFNFIKGNLNFPKPNPNFRAKINGGFPGQCTWYVYNRLAQLGKPIPYYKMGNGGEWWQYAKKYGYPVGRVAKSGFGMSFAPTSNNPYGHIAFVESVNSDGSVYISEMNVQGEFVLSFRTISKEEASRCWFIDFGLR